jgi:hypothetical protein
MKKNKTTRQRGALERLENAKFFEKNGRSEQDWQKKVDKEIEILEKRLNV